ncbi:MAG: phosphate ABC transporter permease subunit PstC [Bdellovibrio sp.]|nr:phosphate ABC transporter permease subunit PstC [Bdellovibrio sp.]
MLESVLTINGLFSAIAVGLIFIFVTRESLPAIHLKGWAFFIDKSWYPLEGQFNVLPMIAGTIFVSLGALILASPLGLFSAIFISFYAHGSLAWPFRRVVELYAGLPSVIFGFWGLMKLVPMLNEIRPPGQSLLAGILILALMIFPIITLNLMANFRPSSKKYYRVALSLGMRKSTYIWSILLPSLKQQIVGAMILALGRAMGETMAVLMVCGNIVKMPTSIFDPIRTLTANIALEMAYAMNEHRSALFFTGLILFLLIFVLISVADFWRRHESWKE